MKRYSLGYVSSFDDSGFMRHVGDMQSRHDQSLTHWEMRVRLTNNGIGVADWFLSIYVNDNDTFGGYCLNYEDAYADDY